MIDAIGQEMNLGDIVVYPDGRTVSAGVLVKQTPSGAYTVCTSMSTYSSDKLYPNFHTKRESLVKISLSNILHEKRKDKLIKVRKHYGYTRD